MAASLPDRSPLILLRFAMKAICLTVSGGPEALVYQDVSPPHPRASEVLVQVHATAVTPTEFSWYPTTHNQIGAARHLPIILGHEFSGVVAAIGTEVTD